MKIIFLLVLSSSIFAQQSNDKITAFAEKIAISAYDYNAISYKNSFTKLEKDFVVAAWQRFYKGIEESGNLANVIKYDMVVTSFPTATTEIKQEGPSWLVSVPMQVNYSNEYINITQQLVTTVTLVVENAQHYKVTDINSTQIGDTSYLNKTAKEMANCKIS